MRSQSACSRQLMSKQLHAQGSGGKVYLHNSVNALEEGRENSQVINRYFCEYKWKIFIYFY